MIELQTKHKPERMCVGCRLKQDKTKLLRITRLGDELVIDTPQHIIARGIYLCNSKECIKLARKKRIVERSFKGINVGDIYEKLESVVES